MKTNDYLKDVIATLALAALLTSGCGKKEEATVTVTPDAPVEAAAAAPAPNTPAPVQIAPSGDASASLAAAQAAMQKQDYERAAAALLSVQNQRQPLTTEQAQAVRNQMVQFQQSLATGVANGDPKAKAAAEMLRRSTMR